MKKLIWAAVGVALLLGSCSKHEKTIENLKTAITAKIAASACYAAYARHASEEGLVNVSSMFAALSVADSLRAARFEEELLRLGVKDFAPVVSQIKTGQTEQNLLTMWQIEEDNYRKTYPAFAQRAAVEKAKRAQQLFERIEHAARKHAEFCIAVKEVISDSLKGDDYVVDVWAVCPECGDIYMITGAPETCNQCGAEAKIYHLFGVGDNDGM